MYRYRGLCDTGINYNTNPQVDEGWCEGTVNGVRGMFPDNFVKLRAVGSTLPPMEGTPATAVPRQEMPLQQSRTGVCVCVCVCASTPLPFSPPRFSKEELAS